MVGEIFFSDEREISLQSCFKNHLVAMAIWFVGCKIMNSVKTKLVVMFRNGQIYRCGC